MKGCCIEYGYETDIKYYLSIVKKSFRNNVKVYYSSVGKETASDAGDPQLLSFSN